MTSPMPRGAMPDIDYDSILAENGDIMAAQTAEIERLRAVLKDIAEYCSGDGRPLGAIDRLAAIRNMAERG